MRIAVLGAYGKVGRHLVTEAVNQGYSVTAVGRDSSKLSRLEAAAYHTGSIVDAPMIRSLAFTHEVIINAAGTEHPTLAEQASESGAAFADISASAPYLRVLGRLQVRKGPVLAGLGLAPGLSNILADATPIRCSGNGCWPTWRTRAHPGRSRAG